MNNTHAPVGTSSDISVSDSQQAVHHSNNHSGHDAGEAMPPTLTNSSVFDRIANSSNYENSNIDFILDIPVQVTVELGRTRMEIRKILKLSQGAVIELNSTVGQPMDILVNGCIVAQGEIVIVGEKYGIRLTDVITPSERIKKLNKI